MLSLITLPFLHRSPSRLKLLFPPPTTPSRLALSSSSAVKMSSTTTTTTTVVEHVVLFKVRESTDPSKTESMITNLRSLSSLDLVTHLTACPILRPRSSAAAGFTHLLHSRYTSKADLASYGTHPAHVAVVKESVLPICDDIMAVDWVAEIDGPAALSPGSAARLTLAKPREGATAEEVVAILDGVKATPPQSDWRLSYGENFSPTRAKGYSVGFITVVPGIEELDAMDAGNEIIEAQKEKVRSLLESIIVVDFVIPAPASASL